MAKAQKKPSRQLVTGEDPDELYPVPSPEEFVKGNAEYLDAPELEKITEKIIEVHGGFGYLKDMQLIYLWKDKGGSKFGKEILATCRRPKGLLAKFCPADFIIWCAADHHLAFRSTRFQIEATLFHELCHTNEDEGEPRLVGHDWEGFGREVELYGPWREDLVHAAKAFEQLKLL